MKSLDELIKILEDILPNPPAEYDLENEGYYIQKDVLQYLKEYRTFLQLSSINNEIVIKETASTYKIELTKPEFKNIIIK